MIINKNTIGLRFEGENGRYVYEGDIVAEKSIKIDLDFNLFVAGSIKTAGSLVSNCWLYVQNSVFASKNIISPYLETISGSIVAGQNIMVDEGLSSGFVIKTRNGAIKSGRWIQAAGEIDSGENIETGGGIVAGLKISANGDIRAGYGVTAGACCWKRVTSGARSIYCREIEADLIVGIVDRIA